MTSATLADLVEENGALLLNVVMINLWTPPKVETQSPLIDVMMNGCLLLDVARCIAEKADPNATDDSGFSVLHLAVERAKREAIEKLLQAGANPNATNADGNTPLHAAVTKRSQRIIKTLLRHGAEVNARNYHGSTPLHMATTWRDEFVIGALLRPGVDVNCQNHAGQTPLDLARERFPKNAQVITAMMAC